ncbi:MAG TPA: biotin/lipoyl-binding protein, partial [Candidatus Dormibacteraeota bacterium]
MSLFQRQYITVAALAFVAIALAVLIGRDVLFPAAPAAASVRTYTVAVGSVRSAVTATGSLVPAAQVNVGFKTAGTLTEVDVHVGDKVTKGQVIGKVDDTNYQAAVQQAQANLDSAQASLQGTLTGTSLIQAQHSLSSAQQSYADTLNSVNLTNSQDQAALSADQATLAADQAQLNADQASYGYQQYQQTMPQYQAKLSYDNAQFMTYNCNPTQNYQGPPPPGAPSNWTYCSNAQQNVQQDLTAINCAQTGAGAGCTPQQQEMASAYRAVQADQPKVNGDQAKVNGDNSRIAIDQQSGQQRANAAQNSVTAAQDSVNQQSVQRPITVAQQEAAVQSAQAALQTAQANEAGTTLLAPMDGTVMALSGQPGENVSASAPPTALAPGTTAPAPSTASSSGSSASSTFMVLSNTATYQVVVPFAEADASRLQNGQTGTVTFDAIQNLTLPAHVLAVASSSTVVSNVVNYNVTLSLDQTDPRLKSGLTTNATIVVASASNVLVVPNSAITRLGGRAFVTVLDPNGQQVRTPVTLGVQGDSTTQVTAGLKAGDKVVLPQLRAGASGTQNQRGGGGFGGGTII